MTHDFSDAPPAHGEQQFQATDSFLPEGHGSLNPGCETSELDPASLLGDLSLAMRQLFQSPERSLG